MMAMVWELPNFAYILYSLYAKICKYQKTGFSLSKTGFRRPGFRRILRFFPTVFKPGAFPSALLLFPKNFEKNPHWF